MTREKKRQIRIIRHKYTFVHSNFNVFINLRKACVAVLIRSLAPDHRPTITDVYMCLPLECIYFFAPIHS